MVGARPIVGPEVLHWQALRGVPERVRKVLTEYDAKLAEVEGDMMLSTAGKQAKLAEVAQQAIAELEKLTTPAESVGRRVGILSKKMDVHLAQANESTSDFIKAEIRAHLKNNGGVKAALSLKDNPAVLAAALGGPPFLSGMSDAEATVLRREAFKHTPEAQELDAIERARGIGADAIRVATGMVNERAGLANAPPQLKAV